MDNIADEYPLASHVLTALKENRGHSVQITVGAGDHAYIRYRDGRWEFVKHVEYDWYAAGYLEEEHVADLASNNGVDFLPHEECHALSGGASYWRRAEDNELFNEDTPLAKWRIKKREDELAPWAEETTEATKDSTA